MDLIDRVFNLDWSDAEHAGGGVFVMDAIHHTGTPSLAVRANRGGEHHVILLERTVFKNLTRYGRMLLARQGDVRPAGEPSHSTLVRHANTAFGCEMYRCPPTCQYADPGPGPPSARLPVRGPGTRLGLRKGGRDADESHQPVATLRQPDRGGREDHRNAGLGPAEGPDGPADRHSRGEDH